MRLVTDPISDWVISTQIALGTDILAAANTEYLVDGEIEVTLPNIATVPFMTAVGIKQQSGHTLVVDNSSETLAIDNEPFQTIMVPEGFKTIFIAIETYNRKYWARLPSTSLDSGVASSSNLADLYGRIKTTQLPQATIDLLTQLTTDVSDLTTAFNNQSWFSVYDGELTTVEDVAQYTPVVGFPQIIGLGGFPKLVNGSRKQLTITCLIDTLSTNYVIKATIGSQVVVSESLSGSGMKTIGVFIPNGTGIGSISVEILKNDSVLEFDVRNVMITA